MAFAAVIAYISRMTIQTACSGKLPYLALAFALVLALPPAPAAARGQDRGPAGPTAAPIPQAVLDGWARLVGTWIADNTAYKSDADPYDAFGIEWSWGIGQKSLVGRLYGIQGGQDVATFWEFREFWHPGEARVVPMQFGAGGVVGTGWHEFQADGRSEMLQTFFDPAAGTVTSIGHRSELSGDRHVTQSFTVEADGTWTPQRSYTWIRQPARGQAEGGPLP